MIRGLETGRVKGMESSFFHEFLLIFIDFGIFGFDGNDPLFLHPEKNPVKN